MNAPPPSRLLYMTHLLDVLRSAGGGLTSSEVFRCLRADGLVRNIDLETIQTSGETRFAKEVRFARLELVRAGLLENSQPGFWALSEIGWATFLTVEEARALIRRRRHGIFELPPHHVIPGPTTGPRPVEFTTTVSRTLEGPSWTYVFRYARSNIWKIGHTEEVATRISAVNRHLPVELTGECWRLFAQRRQFDSVSAFEMEQKLLMLLNDCRTQGERVQCPADRLIEAWRKCAVAERQQG